MAADLIENYEGNPALQFIKDVGVDWEQSKVLNGEIGEFVTIAREERTTGNWFVGGISNEESRDVTINFDFLPKDTTFEAIIYKDGATAHWDKNPLDLSIEKMMLTNTSIQKIHIAAGGGFAISIIKK